MSKKTLGKILLIIPVECLLFTMFWVFALPLPESLLIAGVTTLLINMALIGLYLWEPNL